MFGRAIPLRKGRLKCISSGGLLIGSIAGLLVCFAAATARGEPSFKVRNPNASFVDVAARRQALKDVQTPRLRLALSSLHGCIGTQFPLPPPVGQNIPSRYMSGSHGELNVREHILSEPYYNIQRLAALGADKYLVTGDPQEAACVIQALLPWAQSKALLGYNAKDNMVVWFQSTWTVASLSLSMSIIRSEPTLNPADRDRVVDWLHDAAWKSVNETRGPNSATSSNNHFFWRGLAATAAGVISDDSKLFTLGLRTYTAAIGEIDDQGAFPQEMERHELALHYQAFAIEPLVMIAELASRQGIDPYGLENHGRHLNDAVDFLVRALADPATIKKYTPDVQQTDPDLQPGSALLAWTELWTMRTGSPVWQHLLERPYFEARLAGSTTLFAAPVQPTVSSTGRTP